MVPLIGNGGDASSFSWWASLLFPVHFWTKGSLGYTICANQISLVVIIGKESTRSHNIAPLRYNPMCPSSVGEWRVVRGFRGVLGITLNLRPYTVYYACARFRSFVSCWRRRRHHRRHCRKPRVLEYKNWRCGRRSWPQYCDRV